MLKAIFIGLFTFMTYPLVVEHGLLPGGIFYAVIYGAAVVGAAAIVDRG